MLDREAPACPSQRATRAVVAPVQRAAMWSASERGKNAPSWLLCRIENASSAARQRGRRARAAAFVLAATATAAIAAQELPLGVLHEHPAIQYLTRSTTDRVGALGRAIAAGTRTLERDSRT